MYRLTSLLGIVVLISLAWAFSTDRKRVSPRIVLGGLFLQFTFAILTLKTAPGLLFFQKMGDLFTAILGFVDAGSEFVFGPKFQDFYFAFKVLPTIIFFSALMSITYYLGIMQKVVNGISRIMQVTLKTSGAESLAMASNIFLGQTESPLVIKPYLSKMTLSEIHCVMVGGFGTVAGGVLAAYIGMGIDAGHLVTASIITAPASMLMAKVLLPETKKPVTSGKAELPKDQVATNVLDAAAIGTSDGLALAINVAAMLIAFMALIALIDGTLNWFSGLFGQTWTIATILGYVFSPFAFLMGVEPKDCFSIGQLLGLKIVANEFVAYKELAKWSEPGSLVQISERSRVLVTYALCGFSNLASIGIQLGGIGTLVPERRADLAKVAFRAMIGGALACQMAAAVVGLLI